MPSIRSGHLMPSGGSRGWGRRRCQYDGAARTEDPWLLGEAHTEQSQSPARPVFVAVDDVVSQEVGLT